MPYRGGLVFPFCLLISHPSLHIIRYGILYPARAPVQQCAQNLPPFLHGPPARPLGTFSAVVQCPPASIAHDAVPAPNDTLPQRDRSRYGYRRLSRRERPRSNEVGAPNDSQVDPPNPTATFRASLCVHRRVQLCGCRSSRQSAHASNR